MALLAVALVLPLAVPPAGATGHPTAELVLTPDPAHPGDAVTLDASGSSDPDGEPVTCSFDVDDDGSFEYESQECVASHTFDAVGRYPVTVEVVDGTGRTNETTATLDVVENRPPSPTLEYTPTAPDPGENVTFDGAASSDPDGEVVSYAWEIAAVNTVETATGVTASYVYDQAGEYRVTLTVTDDDGASNETTRIVDVAENRPPEARLSIVPTAPVVDERVTLDGNRSADPDGRIVAWAFDVDGDGTVDRSGEGAPVANVRYDSAGTRTVELRVTDDDGATATAERDVEVATTSTPTPTETAPSATPMATPTATARPTNDSAAAREAGLGSARVVEDLRRLFLGVGLEAVGIGLLLLVGVGGAAAWRRRASLADHLRRLGSRVRARLTWRRVTEKVATKAVKRGIREAGEAIERGGDATGRGLEAGGRRLGQAVRRASRRVGRAIKRLGG